MSAQIQLDLFKEPGPEDVLKAELEALRDSHHAVRKKAFAEICGLRKIVMDQRYEIDFMKEKIGLSNTLNHKTSEE